MDRWDAERWDRARVACILLGEPEPPRPTSSFYGHVLVSLAAHKDWRKAGRPGGLALPLEVEDEGLAPQYALLDGWHCDPHKVGLLSNFNANPYDQEYNRNAFDNGRTLKATLAGKRYRQYVETCRRKAAVSAPGVKIP